jgi:hypothetical protein
MTVRLSLILAALGLCLASHGLFPLDAEGGPPAANSSKPNILIILADGGIHGKRVSRIRVRGRIGSTGAGDGQPMVLGETS